MLLTRSKKKYKYVEIAKYVENLDRVIRLQEGPKHDRQPIVLEVGELEGFRKQNDNIGLYTSVFNYDTKDLAQAVRYGSLYFDFDSEEDVTLAQRDARKVYDYFSDFIPDDQMRLYFTGSKGFHLEIEAATLGVDPSNKLPDYYRFIAELLREKHGLRTLDFKVYDARRMWRLPGSRHQKTGLYKNELPKRALTSDLERIMEYCKERHPYEPPTASLKLEATEWYKDMVVTYEAIQEREEQRRAQKRAELFAKHGSKLAGSQYGMTHLDREWNRVLKKLQNAERGERNNTLYSAAFRIFMAVQRVGTSSVEIEDKLLAVATEIGLGTLESKATIKSALKGAKQAYETDPTNGLL